MGPSLHLSWCNAFEGLSWCWLFAVAVVVDVARALQRDLVRGLRTALLLRKLGGGGRFGGFVGVTDVCTADWIHHEE